MPFGTASSRNTSLPLEEGAKIPRCRRLICVRTRVVSRIAIVFASVCSCGRARFSRYRAFPDCEPPFRRARARTRVCRRAHKRSRALPHKDRGEMRRRDQTRREMQTRGELASDVAHSPRLPMEFPASSMFRLVPRALQRGTRACALSLSRAYRAEAECFRVSYSTRNLIPLRTLEIAAHVPRRECVTS